MTDATKRDWYEHRSSLRTDMVFTRNDGDIVRLDRTVPGDGTKWYVDTWGGSCWESWDETIEPGELNELLEGPSIPVERPRPR